MCVIVYSSIERLPACQIFRISHMDWTVDGITLKPFGYLLEPVGKICITNIASFFLLTSVIQLVRKLRAFMLDE